MDAVVRAKVVVALAAAVLLAGVSVCFIAWSGGRTTPVTTATGERVRLEAGPRLLVIRSRRLVTVSTRDPSAPMHVSTVECVRSYAAAGTAVCLHQDTPWAYSLRTLDSTLRVTRSFRIQGLPNRARVSASGRMVSWTAFVGGDSYNGGQFSTRTGILDTRTGARTDTLEGFTVLREGRPYRNRDLNFWGVTFTRDDNRFYATMSTSGQRYLVEGDYAARRVRTISRNVECPSLSPEGARLAFKQAIGADPDNGWRLSVLDLRSLTVTHLAETRSIDDQAAWISGDEVAYTVRDSSGEPSIWSTPADGSGAPKPLLSTAESPAILMESPAATKR